MTQKHTPEPWGVFSKNGIVEIWNSAGEAIIGWTGFDSTRVQEKAKDNARRIVACVNACARFSDEELANADLWQRAHNQSNSIADLTKQRDDLQRELAQVKTEMKAQSDGLVKQRDELVAVIENVSSSLLQGWGKHSCARKQRNH